MPRLLTYNVHRCIGSDRVLSPERIASVIAEVEPDIVLLQELDVGRLRTGGIDQAHLIARELGMQMHFHAALHVLEERYGDAVLTARPSRLIRAGHLPGMASRPKLEPRGALWAAIDLDGADLQVLTTHFGYLPEENLAQTEALLGPDWLGHPACTDPAIVAGDFNIVPWSRGYRRLSARLRDAQVAAGRPMPQATYPARWPFLRIDHLFVSPSIRVLRTEALRSAQTRIASDHLPLVLDFEIAASAAAMNQSPAATVVT